MGKTGWITLWMLVVVLAIAPTSFGRAGGGGHFSSGGGGHSFGGGSHSFGGGGGGGFSSHGNGSIDGTTLLIIILIIVIVVIINASQNAQAQRDANRVRQGLYQMDQNRRRAMEQELAQRDPQFDAGRFYGRIRDAFLKIQNAWCGHDLTSVRAFLSDGVLERFDLQIDEQKALGIHDHMEAIEVLDVGLDQVLAGAVFESATVRIRASAVDYEAALGNDRYVSGSTEPEEFVEYWTFVRRRGAASITGNGLIEGNCPNCGSSIEMNQNANCPHCGALLKSGQYDWVLVEITQESEYRRAESRTVPGFDELRQKDPELTLEELEDRASVLFWRRMESARLGDVRPLRKVARDEYCQQFAEELKGYASPGGERTWYGDCGVGSVDTVSLISGTSRDQAAIDIRWSGSRFVQQTGGMPRKLGQTPVMRTILVLSRKAGVKSSADKGIASAHCPNCGAPESNSDSNACEFCGTVLNDGSAGWVLEDAPAPNSDRLRTIAGAGSSAAAPSATGLLAWMVQMASSDGQIDDKEQRMLLATAQRVRVSADRVQAMIDAARNGGMQAPQPANQAEARQWIEAMAGVALADGQVSNEEFFLLRKAGARVGYQDVDLKMMIARKRDELIQQSRSTE